MSGSERRLGANGQFCGIVGIYYSLNRTVDSQCYSSNEFIFKLLLELFVDTLGIIIVTV